MNIKSAIRNFKEGYRSQNVKSNYYWTIAGIGITGSLYALGHPEIGKYSAIATSTLCAANLIKQYRKGKTLLKNVEI